MTPVHPGWEPASPGRRKDRYAQAANEFLALVINDADVNQCAVFTSNQAAQWPSLQSYARTYVQKMLSRLGKRGHLLKIKCPRLVRGGYNKGFRNLYAITARGRGRASWFSQNRSLFGMGYLAYGTGSPKETLFAMGLKILSPLFADGPDTWKFRSRDRNSIGFLLTTLSNDIAYSFSIPGFDALVWIQRLKYTGLVPDHFNPPLFHFIAKTFYQQPDELILISTLYKSVVYWKGRCEALEREKRETNSSTWQNEMIQELKSEVAHVSSELALSTQRREYTELLQEDRAAYHKLYLENESRKATLRDVFYYLGYVSNSHNEWRDLMLIPMKMHIQHSLWLARLLLTAFP